MRLTDLAIQRLPPPDKGATTHFDDTIPGFGVRVSSGGTKSFTLIHGKSRQRTAIGRYPIVSLQEARAEAKRILAERTLGKHTAPSKIASEVVRAFLDHVSRKNRPRTYRDYQRILNRHFLPPWKHERLDAISPRAVLDRLGKLKETPSEQNHAFAIFRIFFRWAVRNHYLDRSPMEAMQLPNRSTPRERVLSRDELKAVWKASAGTFGNIVKLLILTGQRRGEIAALRSEWINPTDRTITLPSSITKNRREHLFPFGDLAAELLSETEGYLFPAAREHVRNNPTTSFNGWGKPKAALDKASGIYGWTLHDLRRTFATRLADLDVEPHIVERLLNHISGEISGVSAIYNRAKYLPQMRQAVEKWDQYLAALLAVPA